MFSHLFLTFLTSNLQVAMAENAELSSCTEPDKCKILYDREKYMEEKNNPNDKINYLMERLLFNMKEIDPIINYLHKRVEEYQTTRPYDKVTLVGSIGNKLYVPECLADGSYQIEADVLFERPIDNLALPVTNENEIDECPRVDLEMDSLNSTFPMGSLLLKVKDIHGRLDDFEKDSFLKYNDETPDTYLKSAAYRYSIPHRYSASILGEEEVGTFSAPLLQPLYRTYKSRTKTLHSEGKKYKFVILMDKVAAVRIPWPDIAGEFKTRKRTWPTEKIINNVISEGCHLIHKPANNAKTYMLEWRFTFSTSEQKLALEFTSHQRAIFLVIKQIKRKYFDLGTFESGEAVVGLTTYHLKTVMLWLSESVSHEMWDTSPSYCFILFMKDLQKYIEKDFLPHHFVPSINIFEGAWDHKHLQLNEHDWLTKNQPMRLTLLEKIREIIELPEKFLTDDILHALDKKHVHELEKEPVVVDYFGHLVQVFKDKEEGVENDISQLDFEKLVKQLNEDSE